MQCGLIVLFFVKFAHLYGFTSLFSTRSQLLGLDFFGGKKSRFDPVVAIRMLLTMIISNENKSIFQNSRNEVKACHQAGLIIVLLKTKKFWDHVHIKK